MGTAETTTAIGNGSVDSTAAQNLVMQWQLDTATDTMTMERIIVEHIPGVP